MSDGLTATVQVRVSTAERKSYLAKAKQDGRSLSSWIRRQLNEAK